MAIGKKTGGRNFKPGQSGNPSGRPQIPGDIKEMRKLNLAEFERIANKYFFLTRDDLLTIIADPATPLIEHLIASILTKGIEHGDMARLGPFLDRLIGKVTDRVEHKVLKPFIWELRDGGEIHMGHEPENDEEE